MKDGSSEIHGGNGSSSCGIRCTGSLIFKGSGTLTAAGGEATGENGISEGVYVAGNITVSDGTLTGTGGRADGVSHGVYTNGNVTISGGTLIINRGALFFGGNLTNNGTIIDNTIVPYTPTDVNAGQKAAVKEAVASGAKELKLTYTEGNKIVDKEIFESIAGKDITVTLNMGDAWWIVNGMDIPTDMNFKDLNLGVTVDSDGSKNLIPVDVIDPYTGEVKTIYCEILHNGPFGFRMHLHVKLGQEYAGMSALLRYYNEAEGIMEEVAEGLINSDGIVLLPMDHASKYVITIGTAGMSKQNARTQGTPIQAPVQAAPKSPKTGEDGFGAYYLVLIAVAGIGMGDREIPVKKAKYAYNKWKQLTYAKTYIIIQTAERGDNMPAINITKARENIYQLVSDVNTNCEPVTITNSKGKNAVLIGESDWKAIEETLFLMNIPGMAESIIEGGKISPDDCVSEDEAVW